MSKFTDITLDQGIVRRAATGDVRALPDTPPPREVWRRITEQARAEGLLCQRPRWGGARWLAGAGLAAAVTLSVLQLPWFDARPLTDGPFPTEPAVMESTTTRSLDALMVQSQWLERHLRALPTERVDGGDHQRTAGSYRRDRLHIE